MRAKIGYSFDRGRASLRECVRLHSSKDVFPASRRVRCDTGSPFIKSWGCDENTQDHSREVHRLHAVRTRVLIRADGTFQPSKAVIRVSAFEGHTSYAPYTCPQCDEAWCLTACPVEAIGISPAGAKDVADDICVGCKLCTIACPYGTMFYDIDTHKAFKCDLCGGNPACASVCPTDAIVFEEADKTDWVGPFAAERAKSPAGPLAGVL